MKKVLIIIASLVIVTIITLAIFWRSGNFVGSPTLEKHDEINYNNYHNSNTIDYKNGHFAWIEKNFLGAKLNIVDQANNKRSINSITTPFQLVDNGVAFIKDNKLYLTSFDNKTYKISDSVEKFIVYDNLILYSTQSVWNETKGLYENQFYAYNLSSKQNQNLQNNVYDFGIYDNRIYFLINSVKDETTMVFKSISLENLTDTVSIVIEADGFPFKHNIAGQKLIINYGSSEFNIIDLVTGKTECVRALENRQKGESNFISFNDTLIVSFHATEIDGSIVKKVDNEANGVYVVNLKTFEKEKICNKTFSELYYYSNNQLFGVNGNEVYEINISDGSIKPIIK